MKNTNESNDQISLTKDIREALAAAKNAGLKGIEDPRASIERAKAAAENARDFYYERMTSMDRMIAEKEPELMSRHLALEKLDREIEGQWNSKPRHNKNRSEAQNSIENYNLSQQGNWSLLGLLVTALFICEGIFGYWIFKTFVMPDPGITNEITSIVVGAMVMAVGYFLKVIPDSTENPTTYLYWKRFFLASGLLSGAVFIMVLAMLRQIGDDSDTTSLAAREALSNPSESWDRAVDFSFQISLLLTLMFSGAFLAHYKNRLPKALLKARSEEGADLLSWYKNDQFKFAEKEAELKAISQEIEAAKNEQNQARVNLDYYSPGRIENIKKEACIEFYEGAITPPLTESKKRAAANARFHLDNTAMNKGETHVVYAN